MRVIMKLRRAAVGRSRTFRPGQRERLLTRKAASDIGAERVPANWSYVPIPALRSVFGRHTSTPTGTRITRCGRSIGKHPYFFCELAQQASASTSRMFSLAFALGRLASPRPIYQSSRGIAWPDKDKGIVREGHSTSQSLCDPNAKRLFHHRNMKRKRS